ncbi:MAG: ribbon-helix-helix domain-containing protein [Phycisphaerae bacterium]
MATPDKAQEKGQEIITFKADPSLLAALGGIRNRSEFIRNAVLAALENVCPLCRGRGILTPNQKQHWSAFIADHGLAECDDCHEWHLVCATRPEPAVHGRQPLPADHECGPGCDHTHAARPRKSKFPSDKGARR